MLTGKGRLFVLSFLMLFVELALIRWLPSNIFYLSYFSNFVLLGSFLGIGLGFLRAKAAVDLFRWVPMALAYLVTFALLLPVSVDRSGSQLIYFGTPMSGLPIWFLLPVIFLTVALVMSCVAQGVARSFAQFEPLEAYRLDILGSLAGILAFSLLSFLGAPPLVWGLIVSAVLLVLYGRSLQLLQMVGIAGMLIMLGRESFVVGDSWSPYYKISVWNSSPGIISLDVNGIPHQSIESMALRKRLEPVYAIPYQRVRSNPLRNLLIIGGGNGGDVSIALAAGAKHIDVVEIDPRIYALGAALNPDHPYQDPRVTVHIGDGRAFLEQTTNRYDLILFALPDSLVLISGQSSLRLESYLFTIEATRAAAAHLNPGGAFAMYNYYREVWLVDRLAGTLQATYGRAPCLDTIGGAGHLALLMDSPSPSALACDTMWTPQAIADTVPATDDHPFVYLRTPTIPSLYLVTIVAILIVSLLLIRNAAGPLSSMRQYLDLFFMGAAFLLLETKNVVQFALLFGTTWFVNALVFFGILLSVLAAIEVAQRFRVRQSGWLYVALFATLIPAWAIEPQVLLVMSLPLRFVAAVVLAFAPIFLANLIFAGRFREVGSSTIAFGTNLLGAMVGGLLEYTSLVVGYRSLLLLVALLYACAFLSSYVRLSDRVAEPVSAT